MNETDGSACPDWCRHHRHAGTGEVVAHESRSQIAAAEIDDVPGEAAQAKRLCTLITAAATLP